MSCGQYSTLCINYTVHVISKTLMMKITLCLTKIIILFSVVPYRFEEGSYLSTITVEADFLQKARYMYMSNFIFLLCIITCFIHRTCASYPSTNASLVSSMWSVQKMKDLYSNCNWLPIASIRAFSLKVTFKKREKLIEQMKGQCTKQLVSDCNLKWLWYLPD